MDAEPLLQSIDEALSIFNCYWETNNIEIRLSVFIEQIFEAKMIEFSSILLAFF